MSLRDDGWRYGIRWGKRTGVGLISLISLAVVSLSDARLSRSSSEFQEPYLVLQGPEFRELVPPVEIVGDGVRDASGALYRWDTIVGGDTGTATIGDFRRQQRALSLKLYLMRERLARQDWEGLREILEDWDVERVRGTCYEGWSGACWFQLHRIAGRREEMALELLRLQDGDATLRRGVESLSVESGFFSGSPNEYPLTPVFFDSEAARRVLASLRKTDQRLAMAAGRTGTGEIYLAALELAAGHLTELNQRLNDWKDREEDSFDVWIRVFRLAIEIDQEGRSAGAAAIESNLAGFAEMPAKVATYWLNRRATLRAQTDQQVRRAMLDWLSLAATLSADDSGAAAAAVFEARELADRNDWFVEKTILENELYKNYANSYHVRLLVDGLREDRKP